MTLKRRLVLAYLSGPVLMVLWLLLLPGRWGQLAWIGPLLCWGYAAALMGGQRPCGHGPLSLGPGRLFWPWPFDCPRCGAPPD